MSGEDDDVRYLYVIGFTSGLVKVGHTRDVRQRYKTHRSWARARGIEIVDVDYSYRHGTTAPDERRLIRFCTERWYALPGYAEVFVDADFDEVHTYFRALENMAAAGGWVSELI
jgi:hypothetical protein